MATKRKATADASGFSAKRPAPSASSSTSAATASASSRRPEAPAVDGIDKGRARTMTDTRKARSNGDCVVYWMSRDQRVEDNWAMLYARGLASSMDVPLVVVFNLVPKFLEATMRQFGFMLRGLKEVEASLRKKNIPFHLLTGDPVATVPEFAEENNAAAVVADMSPLRVPMQWVTGAASALDEAHIPLYQVDAHNIVPVWIASPKQEVGARTIRRKIHDHMAKYLRDFPVLVKNPPDTRMPEPTNWDQVFASLQVDRSVKEVDWCKPGTTAGMAAFKQWADTKLKLYADKRNNPTEDVLSNISPWRHFGQISSQRLVLELKKNYASKCSDGVKEFVEENVVRRELADNFCFYNKNYDSLAGAAPWAQETLDVHSSDKREYLYTREQLEKGETHDDLWNAAQIQMVKEGKMHGFLRMYWAKKILEWTKTPEEALAISIYLNDRYELDGRDPNGYVGCMWSIAGIHDQGWKEREVFGKIRYMNYKGCQRKFDVNAFVRKYPPAAKNAVKASGQGVLKTK